MLLFFRSPSQSQAEWKRKSTTFHGPSRPIFRVWLFQNLSPSISPAAAERAVSSWSSVHCQTAKLPKSNYACAPAHARARAPAALSACTALARTHTQSLAKFRFVLSSFTLLIMDLAIILIPTGLCKVTGYFHKPFNSYIHME